MVNLPATQHYTPRAQAGQLGVACPRRAADSAFTEPTATDLELRRAEQRRKRYKRKAPTGVSRYPFDGKQLLIYDCPHTVVFVCPLDGLRVKCQQGGRLTHKTADGTIDLLSVLRGRATQGCQQCPFHQVGNADLG